ncbi:MAG: hypothetical protein ACPGXK_11715 [Phycisphaerae bacterium]
MPIAIPVFIADLFITGIALSSTQRFFMMLPLCLAVAIVYKTTRLERLQDVPKATAVLWVTIILAMYGVGTGLWLMFNLLT